MSIYIRPIVLRILLERKNADQSWLARKVGVSVTTVSLWMNMKASPSGESRKRILLAFNGVSHKPGGRLKWDDLFRTDLMGSGGAI